MNRPPDWFSQRIYYLASGLLVGAVFLRSILIYRDSPVLAQALALLLVWLVLFASEARISRWRPAYFWLYLVFQLSLVAALLAMPGFPDFFATLLLILSMQVMRRANPQIGAIWIAICALMTASLLTNTYGISQAIALTLVYTAGNLFFGSYTYAISRAQGARLQNQALAAELQDANQKLQASATRLEQLAVARERFRLARELHDSVTQTIFSMTLTTQSAILLLDRDPVRVKAQLEQLSQLIRYALSEIQALISELKPERESRVGLASALRRHLADSCLPQNLTVSLEVEGEQPLGSAEEQGLFRIAQEALNNVVKHSQASRAAIRLHLCEPFWMEIEDHGLGFDLRAAENSGRVGLASMRERAEEIGWNLHIHTAPGAGARLRVEKAPARERQL